MMPVHASTWEIVYIKLTLESLKSVDYVLSLRARSLTDRITGFGPVDRGSIPRELIQNIILFLLSALMLNYRIRPRKIR